MDNLFRMEVNTGNGGYGFTDTLSELIIDVNIEYDGNEAEKVYDWAKDSKEGDEYISKDTRMHIYNIGNDKETDNMNSKQL